MNELAFALFPCSRDAHNASTTVWDGLDSFLTTIDPLYGE
jgi:hypothetical protein